LVFIRNVHWLHALVTATSIVSLGPSNSSAAKSTAYETDIVEPLLASGRLTLKAEVMADVASSTTNSVRLWNWDRGPRNTTSMAPTVMVAPTYKRADSGRERMCAAVIRLFYEPHTALDRVATAFSQCKPRLELAGRRGALTFLKPDGAYMTKESHSIEIKQPRSEGAHFLQLTHLFSATYIGRAERGKLCKSDAFMHVLT
jgi:hypothetical protein